MSLTFKRKNQTGQTELAATKLKLANVVSDISSLSSPASTSFLAVSSTGVPSFSATSTIPTVPVSVANGGTGTSILSSGQVLVGNGTSAVTTSADTSLGVIKFISSQSPTNGTTNVDFSINAATVGASTTKLKFLFEDVRSNLAATYLNATISSDGSSYSGGSYFGGVTVQNFSGVPSPSNVGSTTAVLIAGGFTNTAGESFNGEMTIMGMTATNMMFYSSGIIMNTSLAYSCIGGSIHAPLRESIRFSMTGGTTFKGGKISLYAISG